MGTSIPSSVASPGSLMKAWRFQVHGLVQGVGFRWSTQETARRLGLAGWVRNEDDGSVTGLVQGPEGGLAEFRRWLDHGPPGAQVRGVLWVESEPTGYRLFVIR